MQIRSISSPLFAVAAVGAMALTACSSSGGGGGGGATSAAGGGSSPAPVTSSSSSGGGGLGGATGNAGGGGGGNTVTIGFEGPLSGANAQLGINEINAVKVAVADANKDSSLGFKVTLESSDDEGDPTKSPAAATKLINDPKVLGVIGPSFSGSTLAVGAKYSQAPLTFITPSASNATLQDQHWSTFHRIIPNDNVEGSAAADWLARKGIKKLFVLQDLSAYGKGVGDTVAAEARKKGINVTEQGLDGTTTKNYNPIAQTIAKSGAQALFYGGYDAQAALLAKALNNAGFKGLKIGGNGIKSSVFTQGAGTAGNGWYFSCGCQDATVSPQDKQFAAQYQQMFKTPPSTYSPEAFDAANVLIQAIKDAGGASATRQQVEDATDKINYKGITTTISFESNGEVTAKNLTVNLYIQKNGKIVSLGDISKLK